MQSLDDTTPYLRAAISNGHPVEQSLIRKYWHEVHGAKGRLVWEYCLDQWYADAIWFPDIDAVGEEQPGFGVARKYPLAEQRVILCEAKLRVTPELIGQALAYRQLARRLGGLVERTIIFAQVGSPSLVSVAEELGLEVVLSGGA